ncbi:unnamed protein product [Protopolystoma xenopodis]|uniref:Laminin N-terminal domain-containing protein n=1 Tax=Protopolystoma xenopodis TaxID=117903 RepID=A0A448WLR7_9PLAT|nr:unnamed protein product [Protopolystoma xenopodis]
MQQLFALLFGLTALLAGSFGLAPVDESGKLPGNINININNNNNNNNGGVGGTGVRVVYEDARSFCHAEGKAHHCQPQFTNLAEGLVVQASSTCGAEGRGERICRRWRDESSESHVFCETCNARRPAEAHGADKLTDRHSASNQTCWISGPVARAPDSSRPAPPRPGVAPGLVNLTISLAKRFEVFYISLQPCGQLPDSIAVYKSADFGASWQPWQYFSRDCYRAFKLPTSNAHNAQISSTNIQEVLCVDLPSPTNFNRFGQTTNVLPFSTTIGRPSAQPWSPALIEWMTVTDVRISLIRSPRVEPGHAVSGQVESGQTGPGGRQGARISRQSYASDTEAVLDPEIFRLDEHASSDGHLLPGHRISSRQLAGLDTLQHYQADSAIGSPATVGKARNGETADAMDAELNDDVVHFGFSDLSIGGRCKCNGHASRCVRDRLVETTPDGLERVTWGQLRCDCQHNTQGVDCEACAPGYLDSPWARATTESAQECKRT